MIFGLPTPTESLFVILFGVMVQEGRGMGGMPTVADIL